VLLLADFFSINVLLHPFFTYYLSLFLNTAAGAKPYLTGAGFAQCRDLGELALFFFRMMRFLEGQTHCWGMCVHKYKNKGTEYIFI